MSNATGLIGLEKHRLFDARAPRYTSYLPANHFVREEGQRQQAGWLRTLPDGYAGSVYVHIPFCNRLCYFYAGRTQGMRTKRPVGAYLVVLIQELRAVRQFLSESLKMARLHLGWSPDGPEP